MQELKTGSDLVPTPTREADAVVVTVMGEVDLHNSPDLRVVLLQATATNPPKRLILNLAEVPYMDSSAIAVLVETLQKLRKTGGRIFLTDLHPRVKGLLEIARLDTIFTLVKDVAEAKIK